jgi:hypothetical protein
MVQTFGKHHDNLPQLWWERYRIVMRVEVMGLARREKTKGLTGGSGYLSLRSLQKSRGSG